MSKENDQIKSLFQEAFDKESIAFSEPAWNDMELLLNQRKNKRGLWWWITGIGISGLCVSLILIYTNNTATTYDERTHAALFSPIKNANVQGTRADQAKNETRNLANNPQRETPNNAQTESEKPREIKTIALQNSPNASSNTNSQTPREPGLIESAANDNPEWSEPVARVPVFLDTMKTLDWKYANEANIKDREENEESWQPKKSFEKYLLFGLSKTLQTQSGLIPNFGQSIAAGLTYQLKQKVFLSAELNLVRDQTHIANENTLVYYGLSKESYTVNSQALELVSMRLPLMVHYRWNRLWVGSGIYADYLNTIKIEETSTKNSTGENQVLQSGYFTWDQYRTINAGVLIDMQYQLNPKFFGGIRTNFHFMNPSKQSTDRLGVFNLYIKYNL